MQAGSIFEYPYDGEVGDVHFSDFPGAVRVDLGVELKVYVAEESRGKLNVKCFRICKGVTTPFFLDSESELSVQT